MPSVVRDEYLATTPAKYLVSDMRPVVCTLKAQLCLDLTHRGGHAHTRKGTDTVRGAPGGHAGPPPPLRWFLPRHRDGRRRDRDGTETTPSPSSRSRREEPTPKRGARPEGGLLGAGTMQGRPQAAAAPRSGVPPRRAALASRHNCVLRAAHPRVHETGAVLRAAERARVHRGHAAAGVAHGPPRRAAARTQGRAEGQRERGRHAAVLAARHAAVREVDGDAGLLPGQAGRQVRALRRRRAGRQVRQPEPGANGNLRSPEAKQPLPSLGGRPSARWWR